jgi:SAM-dependent methyltransferase
VRANNLKSETIERSLDWGSLRRTSPIARLFGFYRGLPIDRYYIESFLSRYGRDIRGRVLEIGDNSYTLRFGAERVSRSDVLHVNPGSPGATIIGTLEDGENIPSGVFDCIILTQTLHLIYEIRAAISTVHRILKPGGVVLATVPGITQISHSDWGHTWYWALTRHSAHRLFCEKFDPEALSVESHGNVLAASAMLHGLVVSELRTDELDVRDPAFEVSIQIRGTRT